MHCNLLTFAFGPLTTTACHGVVFHDVHRYVYVMSAVTTCQHFSNFSEFALYTTLNSVTLTFDLLTSTLRCQLYVLQTTHVTNFGDFS